MVDGKLRTGVLGVGRPALTAVAALLLSGCALQGLSQSSTTPAPSAAADSSSPQADVAAAPIESSTTAQSLEMYVYPKDGSSSGYQVLIDL
ncbi:hypothetical protein [Motiliproteus coralliicola]|uniref:hypothetical protein n=1 Tax=Motiliproteus coralliicola TaxID=2283196 RepID=UPI001058482F|nr:hypothetical protein [Motiliproteus coralliicola]